MAIPLLLQPQSLLGLVEKFKAEESMLLQWFPDRAYLEPGQEVSYDTIQYSRDMAKINIRGGAPNVVRETVRGNVKGKAITISEEIEIPATVIKDLRALGSLRPGPASDWVARQMENLRGRIAKRKAYMAAQCLGIASGNLSFRLPGTAADETVSLNYLAANKAIGSAWSTAATDILSDIRDAKALVRKNGGKRATEILLNSTTAAYFTVNTAIKAFLSDRTKDEVLVGESGTVERICGLNVQICDEVYVDDDTGTETSLIPDDHVAIFSGDNKHRGMYEMSPASLHAPDSTRGMFFWVFEGPGINDPIRVQCEYSFFPFLANPSEVAFDTDIT